MSPAVEGAPPKREGMLTVRMYVSTSQLPKGYGWLAKREDVPTLEYLRNVLVTLPAIADSNTPGFVRIHISDISPAVLMPVPTYLS